MCRFTVPRWDDCPRAEYKANTDGKGANDKRSWAVQPG